MHDLFGKAALFTELGGAFARFFVQRFEGGIFHIKRHHLFGGHNHRLEVSVNLSELQGGGTLLTLQEQLHATKSPLDLTDPGDDAGGEEDIRGGFLGVVALGDSENQPVPLERRFDGAEGPGAARRNWGGDAGENDRPAKRQDRKCLALAHDIQSC